MKRTTDIRGSARLYARFVYHIHRIVRRFDCRRVGIEHDGVACGEHSDRVADYRFAGVGARRYRADYSERSHFDKGKSLVSRPGSRFDVLRAGGHLCGELVF